MNGLGSSRFSRCSSFLYQHKLVSTLKLRVVTRAASAQDLTFLERWMWPDLKFQMWLGLVSKFQVWLGPDLKFETWLGPDIVELYMT